MSAPVVFQVTLWVGGAQGEGSPGAGRDRSSIIGRGERATKWENSGSEALCPAIKIE